MSDSYTPTGAPADWSLVPKHTAESLRLYLEGGLDPGGFVTAVLSNDLKEAVLRADETNAAHLVDIVNFLHKHVPMEAWGSPEKVQKWSEKGGLNRRPK